jgi:hypothetical protein
MSSWSFSDGRRRSDLAGLYLRLADTLEGAAQLADAHAERYRRTGRSDIAEVAHAERAREAAERARIAAAVEDRLVTARDLASQLPIDRS